MEALTAERVIKIFLANAPIEWQAYAAHLVTQREKDPDTDDWDIRVNDESVGTVRRLGQRIYVAFTRYPREVGL